MQSEMKSRDPVISLEHIFEKYFFFHPVLWMSSQNSAVVSFLVAHAAPSQDPAYPQASVDWRCIHAWDSHVGWVFV